MEDFTAWLWNIYIFFSHLHVSFSFCCEYQRDCVSRGQFKWKLLPCLAQDYSTLVLYSIYLCELALLSFWDLISSLLDSLIFCFIVICCCWICLGFFIITFLFEFISEKRPWIRISLHIFQFVLPLSNYFIVYNTSGLNCFSKCLMKKLSSL